MGMSRQRYDPPALPLGKDTLSFYRKLGGPSAGLDGCGESRTPHRDSIPGLSRPYPFLDDM
jgi:hypothetical protein